MAESSTSVEQAIEAQAASAAHIGSPLYAHLLEGLLTDLHMGGITAELLDGVSDRPMHDAVPLRYLATAHRLALAGDAPELAQYYPSCGGSWHGENIAREFISVAHRHRDDFIAGMQRNVQTNEVGRAPVLACAFALISHRFGLPLDLYEIGSSDGLLSRWDQYRYDTGHSRLGDPESNVRFEANWWSPPAPPLHGEVRVAHRRGNDIAPINANTPDGRLTMMSFVWPDHVDRMERLRAALDIAARFPVTIDQADAGEWLTHQLASSPREGVATVVFHSIVWQYLPRPTRDRVRGALYAAAARAKRTAPLLWVRMEPATAAHADVRLTTWPGGSEEVLAEVGYHGADIRWLQRD